MGLPKLQDYLPSALDPHQKSSSLEMVIDKFIDDLENWPRLTEEDVEKILAELAWIEKTIDANRAMVLPFKLGRHRLMSLRDKVLVREAQEMSRSSFWSDDES